MNMNINGFNMGNIQINQGAFQEIQKICTEHPACKNCPVYDNNGLHSNNNSVTLCQKVMEKMSKEQNNGNSQV